jgi:hypothetical protein
MGTPPVRVWVVLRPDGTIIKGSVRNQSTTSVQAAASQAETSWPEMLEAGYTQRRAQITVLEDEKEPVDGEWWICTTRPDMERYGSISGVPEQYRFVAYYNDLGGDEPKWQRTGGRANDWLTGWIVPIRKVALMHD